MFIRRITSPCNLIFPLLAKVTSLIIDMSLPNDRDHILSMDSVYNLLFHYCRGGESVPSGCCKFFCGNKLHEYRPYTINFRVLAYAILETLVSLIRCCNV